MHSEMLTPILNLSLKSSLEFRILSEDFELLVLSVKKLEVATETLFSPHLHYATHRSRKLS